MDPTIWSNTERTSEQEKEAVPCFKEQTKGGDQNYAYLLQFDNQTDRNQQAPRGW
jgi:hypothetical protein